MKHWNYFKIISK